MTALVVYLPRAVVMDAILKERTCLLARESAFSIHLAWQVTHHHSQDLWECHTAQRSALCEFPGARITVHRANLICLSSQHDTRQECFEMLPADCSTLHPCRKNYVLVETTMFSRIIIPSMKSCHSSCHHCFETRCTLNILQHITAVYIDFATDLSNSNQLAWTIGK